MRALLGLEVRSWPWNHNPLLIKLFSMVAQEEQKNGVILNESEVVKALAVQQDTYKLPKPNVPREMPFCIDCKKPEHIIDTSINFMVILIGRMTNPFQ